MIDLDRACPERAPSLSRCSVEGTDDWLPDLGAEGSEPSRGRRAQGAELHGAVPCAVAGAGEGGGGVRDSDSRWPAPDDWRVKRLPNAKILFFESNKLQTGLYIIEIQLLHKQFSGI